MAFPSSAYSLPEKRPDTLRVPLNSPQLTKRQQQVQKHLAGLSSDDSDGYIPGRGLEADIGGFLYTHWQYGFIDFTTPEINIEKEGQNWVIKSDEWLNWLEGTYPGIDTKGYRDRVNDLFADEARRKFLSVEEMFAEIVKIRREIFSEEMKGFDSAILKATGEKSQRIASIFDKMQTGFSRQTILSAIFCDFGENIYETTLGAGETKLDQAKLQEWLRYGLPIDDIDDFIDRVKEPTHYVHVAGSVNGLAADLKAFAEYLLTSWGDEGSVTFVAKDERIGQDATVGDIEALLATEEFSKLRELRDSGRFEIVSSGSNSPGINFRNISAEFADCLDEVNENNAALGIKGETNNFTSNSIDYEHFRFLVSRDIETRRMMGVFWDMNETESPIPVVLRVPAGIAIADRWVKSIFATQFYRARNEFEKDPKHDYAALKETMRKEGLSFVEASYPEALLLPAEYKGLREEYLAADKTRFPTLLDYTRHKRQEIFNGIAASIIGVDEYTGYVYSLKGDGKALEIIESDIKEGLGSLDANVLVSGGLFDPREWEIGAVRAKDVDTAYGSGKRTLVSHDWVFGNIEGARVSINALYFFTPTLLGIYNRYRDSRPGEQIEDVNFYIDAYLTEDGYENTPLYNKAYFGIDDKGGLVFGRRRLLGGTMTINGKDVRWEETQVINKPGKQVPDEDITVYTPMMAESNSSVSNRDNEYTVSVGEDRINLIIINNKIQAIIEGDVLLPSVGIVLSLKENKFIKIFGENALSEFDGKAFEGELPKVRFKFNWPKELPRPQWYLGGGTMLVMKGKNLVVDKDEEIKNFTEEGWFNLLSMQTQETQVQDWVRGPRMILGTTKTGKTFTFSFSGRSALYSGVNFAEAIEIVKRELEKKGEEIANAINLDGGSSVAFNVKGDDGEIYTTSWPAIGPDNAEGLRRPVSGCVYFIHKDVRHVLSQTIMDNYPGFKPGYTKHGNLNPPIIQRRDDNLLGDGSIAQISILPMPSSRLIKKGSNISRDDSERKKLLEKIVGQVLKISGKDPEDLTPASGSKPEKRIYNVEIDNEMIQFREGGAVTIDITKIPPLGVSQPTKDNAMRYYLNEHSFNPSQGIYIGNETKRGARDGLMLEIQGLNVLAVDKEQDNVAHGALKIGAGVGNTGRVLSRLVEIYEEQGQKDISEAIRTLVNEERQKLGLAPLTKTPGFQGGFIGLDIDETVLGTKVKEGRVVKEDLKEDRDEILEALTQLVKFGFKIAFFTDNDSQKAKETIGKHMLEALRDDPEAQDKSIEFFACGMVSNFKLSFDKPSYEDSYTHNTDYSRDKTISERTKRKILQVVGEVIEDADGSLIFKGELGRYYRSITTPTAITDLGLLKQTVVLFLGKEVEKNPDGFRQALNELGENNTVVVITDEKKAFIDFCLDNKIDTGRFFVRTPEELGLSGFNLDQVMSLIMGIDDLRCIPLTDGLTDAYEALKKARDQV